MKELTGKELDDAYAEHLKAVRASSRIAEEVTRSCGRTRELPRCDPIADGTFGLDEGGLGLHGYTKITPKGLSGARAR